MLFSVPQCVRSMQGVPISTFVDTIMKIVDATNQLDTAHTACIILAYNSPYSSIF